MASPDRSRIVQQCFRATAALFVCAALFVGTIGSGLADASPEAGSTSMPEATADDVTIRLLSWEQTDAFRAELEIVNANDFAISILISSLQLQARLPDGSLVVRAAHTGDSLGCGLAPGSIGRMTVEFDTVDGQTPTSLAVGISEPFRTGAKIIFPLDSNTGPSAIGGNAIAGGEASAIASPAAPVVDVAAASPEGPEATPANECMN